ncbi:PucR family transcriptional regulator [Paenibacillus puldeungensis]|uniref:PucR family transcriptional regulator n=1 Tax=Paenibacillus puldeungensis TaxID=696536 RepID=A0ABW3RT03_9BACL
MISVRDALSIEQLKEAQLKAGSSGLDREITTVTIMDIPEIVDWLNGGELVIAGVLFEQCFSRKLVDALMGKGIAGIVTKDKFTRMIPQELFEYCDEVGFPVILAPAYCNWGQIMNPILKHIVRKPYLMIEEGQKIHFTLMRAMLDGVSLSEICTKMHESTGLSHAIMDNDLYLIGFSSNFDWKEYTRNITQDLLQYSEIHFQTLDDNSIIPIYSYTSKSLRSLHLKLLFYPVSLEHTKYGYVVLALDESISELPPTEIVKIQQLGLIVALHSTKLIEISNATRRFNGLLMDQLLQESNLTQARAEALLAPTGKKIHRKYYVVQFLYEEFGNIDSFVQQNSRLGQFHEMAERQISNSNHILVFEKSNSQILLIPYPTENLAVLLSQLRNIFLTTTNLSRVYIGVSDSTPLHEIKKAFVQAERTANYLLSIKSNQLFCYYSSLGVLKFFMDNEGKLDAHFLRSFYGTYITPLMEHDQKYHTQLLETIELYLANNCSKTTTEKQLFIHKNTLRARLTAISKVLHCDVNSTEDLFNIKLALKLRHFFEYTDRH